MTLQQTVQSPQLETDRAAVRDYFITWLLVSFLALHGGAVAELAIGGATGSFVRSLLWFVVAPAIVMFTIRHSTDPRW